MSEVEKHVQALILLAIESFRPGEDFVWPSHDLREAGTRNALAEHIANKLTDLSGIGGAMYVMRYAERGPDLKVKVTREHVGNYPEWLREHLKKKLA